MCTYIYTYIYAHINYLDKTTYKTKWQSLKLQPFIQWYCKVTLSDPLQMPMERARLPDGKATKSQAPSDIPGGEGGGAGVGWGGGAFMPGSCSQTCFFV